MIEEELVKNSRKVSVVRLRARWDEIDLTKLARIQRQSRGNVVSEGRIGSYQ